jgi:23S rRNA (adenine2503-C2)-methyltransferase
MGCSFCATGTLGLKRSLKTSEIVSQVYQALYFIKTQNAHLPQEEQRNLSHLVFMGMGEPLHDFESTQHALEILLDQRGVCFKSRHITVSTVGLVPNLKRFSAYFKGRVQLALSLHAGTDSTRCAIIPVAKKWKLADLKQALLDHPLPNSRVLMLEYVVLPGINDSDEELDGVAQFCTGLRALINLIPFNPFANSPYRSPTQDEVQSIYRRLKDRGVPCSIRITRGQDKAGACGQLALQGF